MDPPGAKILLSDDVYVETLKEEWLGEYEAFVAASPHASIYHSLRYRRLVMNVLGCEGSYKVAIHQGEIRGVLPVMAIAGPYGRVVNSLPFFGSYGGVLASSAAAADALCAAYDREATAPGVCASTWISTPTKGENARKPIHNFVDRRLSHVTSLADIEGNGVSAIVESSAIRNVRKAARLGVKVRIDNAEFGLLEALHRRRMAKIRGTAKPHQFFEILPQVLRAGTDYQVFVAEEGGTAVGALLCLYFGETVEYFVPAALPSAQSDQPLAALLMTAMTDAVQRGFRWWNWGGTWLSQTGVRRFKKKWGARESTYEYYIQVNDPVLWRCPPEELRSCYPYFFVLPFDGRIDDPLEGAIVDRVEEQRHSGTD